MLGLLLARPLIFSRDKEMGVQRAAPERGRGESGARAWQAYPQVPGAMLVRAP